MKKLILLAGLAIANSAHAVPLGEVVLEQEYQGITIRLPVKLDFEATTSTNALELKVDMDASLADLQANLPKLAGTFALPTDNCPRYGQHPVAKLKSISLKPEGSRAVIDAKASVAMWDCQKGVPGVGTTVVWKNDCVTVFGKRMCTKVPQKVTIKPGPDIKNKLVEDDVTASIALSLASPDGVSIAIVPSDVNVRLHNDITRFLNAIAGMFNASVSQLARKEIAEYVNAGALRKGIPEDLLKYNPKVSNISFYGRADGSLGLKASFASVLTGEQLNAFLKDALTAPD